MIEKTFINIEATINAPLQKVWECWTLPAHIINWNFANEDWCCPKAENKLEVDGSFSYRMESKDGTMGFDFSGVYDSIIENEKIEITLDDNRKWKIYFKSEGATTLLSEAFEAESTNPIELQQLGWQSILNNFKQYVEHL